MCEREQLHRIEAKVDQALKLLTGNGHPETGVVFRLVKLEQSAAQHDASRMWFLRTVIGTCITLAIGGMATAAITVIKLLP